MNPTSPEQRYPLHLVEQALDNCLQEQENIEFFINLKTSVLQTIQHGLSYLNEDEEDITLSNGLVLPSPRRILEHDEQLHIVEVERQKALLAEVKTAEQALRNAIRRHKQSYEDINMRRLVKRQLKYDRFQALTSNLRQLQDNISSLRQDVDRHMASLNQNYNQATSSSITDSATPNND